MRWGRWAVAGALVGAVLAVTPNAFAEGWFPHPENAEWVYAWTDTQYATTPTKEKVTVKELKGASFRLKWTTDELANPDAAVKSNGEISFQDTNSGLINTDWSSSPPPPAFPILCAQLAGCPNALSSTLYNVIWGSRTPVLSEPVLVGGSWSSAGGAAGDVSSASTYIGAEPITVPAFPMPVMAARVETQITQAGALGDPYGSGVRTVWWVYGVGPVKVEFQHAGGINAPFTSSELQSTNLEPLTPPGDANYFPLKRGASFTYSWTNKKHLKKPQVERFTIDAIVNNSARFVVKDVSGPIKVAGSYGFSTRVDGVTNLWATVQAATKLKLPKLGPGNLPEDKRRHFFTPFDLMTFGYNPILPAYPAAGDRWSAVKPSRDYSIFGVVGDTEVSGLEEVKVPAGKFQALVVRSVLWQSGFPFGSGTRTAWFAPGKGLVKLVFRHGDASTSTVELVK